MAVDVFDDDDCRVDQEPQREQEGEERDPVDRLAGDISDEEGDGQDGRNGKGNDQRFAPAEYEDEQDRNYDDGNNEVENEFVDRFVGAFAVVAGDGITDALFFQQRLVLLQLFFDLFGDDDGIGPFEFGDRQRHLLLRRNEFPLFSDVDGGRFEVLDVIAVFDFGDVAQGDWGTHVLRDDDIFDVEHRHCILNRAGRDVVGQRLNRLGDLAQGEVVTGELVEVDKDVVLMFMAALECRDSDVGQTVNVLLHLLDRVVELGGVQFGRVLGIKGDGDDRDVDVDVEGFDDGLHRIFGEDVCILHDLVVDLEVGVLFFFSDIEGGVDDADVVHRHPVDVFDAEYLFHLPL